jgi:hypothetical protein
MRGDEKRVVDAFAAWLQENGWTADTEVNFVDVCARRGDERLYAEAKGRTAAIGLDVDTLYGQLLRRIADPGECTRDSERGQQGPRVNYGVLPLSQGAGGVLHQANDQPRRPCA